MIWLFDVQLLLWCRLFWFLYYILEIKSYCSEMNLNIDNVVEWYFEKDEKYCWKQAHTRSNFIILFPNKIKILWAIEVLLSIREVHRWRVLPDSISFAISDAISHCNSLRCNCRISETLEQQALQRTHWIVHFSSINQNCSYIKLRIVMTF